MSEKEPTYNESQIAERLKDLPGWFYEGGWIRRNYKTDGWPTTLMLVTTSAIVRKLRIIIPISQSPMRG